MDIERVLFALYRAIPEWFLAVALLGSGVSFALNAWWHRQRGVAYILWPFSAGIAAALILMGLAYAWMAAMPETPLDLWRGAIRFLFVILSATILLYNGGAIHVSSQYLWRRWKRRK